MVGELFGSFSLTVTAALLASLLVSLTVVPVLSYWFLRAPKAIAGIDPEEARRRAEEKENAGRLQRIYVPVLRFATRRRLTSVLIAVVILVGTFGMAGLLKTNFFDQGEQDTLSIKQELARGHQPGRGGRGLEEGRADPRRRPRGQELPGHRRLLRLHGGLRRRHRRQPGLVHRDAEERAATTTRRTTGLRRPSRASRATRPSRRGGGFGSQDLSVVVKAADGDVLKKASEQVRAARREPQGRQ